MQGFVDLAGLGKTFCNFLFLPVYDGQVLVYTFIKSSHSTLTTNRYTFQAWKYISGSSSTATTVFSNIWHHRASLARSKGKVRWPSLILFNRLSSMGD